MLFSSLKFFIFFPIVTTLYFLSPPKYRCALLLFASCIFYMAFIPAYILILFGLITIDYFMGICIETSPANRKKYYLIVSILSTCLALFIFKYFNFFSGSCQSIAHFIGWNMPLVYLQLILPLGLSFHTFQSLAYIIEVYRGKQKAEKNYWIYSLYVMFYPQLVAGPIERPYNLIHQFYETHHFDYQRVTDGLKLMAWGLFKKVVIADRLAPKVNEIYGDPRNFHGPALALATVYFAIQIYCDFSGYTDMAIGAAQVMGFKLMTNFNRPYFARSIAEFWHRWHISLSTWFRDYLYISLGGNRCSKLRWYFNLFITFLVSGLWHGANWTFVIWGALNGFYYIFAVWTNDLRSAIREKLGITKHIKILEIWQILITFSLICFAWIFFRAQNLHDALIILSQLPHGWGHLNLHEDTFISAFGVKRSFFLYSLSLIGFLVIVHILQGYGSIRQIVATQPVWVRWSLYYLIMLAIFLGGNFGENPFIYFQF